MPGMPVGDAHCLRVVLVNCRGVLGDIIRTAVTEAPDIEVVANLSDHDSVTTALGEADLVLWNDADESRLERILGQAARRHAPRVLATLGDGRDAALWELVPRRTALGAMSPSSLIDAIRVATAVDGSPA
jgi:hypothetical protein